MAHRPVVFNLGRDGGSAINLDHATPDSLDSLSVQWVKQCLIGSLPWRTGDSCGRIFYVGLWEGYVDEDGLDLGPHIVQIDGFVWFVWNTSARWKGGFS